VLEPRRLAARAAAERMAKTLGEKVGETLGLRVRFGSKVSARTRIEIVTEGVFTRLILDDPMLEGVAAVLFDEFHERSLDADLGLALARDVQQGLREDLRLVVMSATIDGARVAKLLGDAPMIASEGRAFPVETRYLGRDPRPIEPQMADAIARAVPADAGSVLAFLPGAAEIRRTAAQLEGRLGADIDVVTLYGALAGDEQDRAIAPAAPGRRKIVLATSIAETSITIEGVRIVVDSGLARVPRFEPDVGVTRLETVRVSRAAADQRRGRAGRIEPGICYRLWDEPRRPRRSSRLRGRKFCRRIFRPSRLILPPGVRRPSNLLFSTHRRARRSRKQRPYWRSLAPSTPMGASPMKDRSCGNCRCRRGLRAWWSMPRPLAPRSTQPKSRC
jgi:ATP-dependent RNA helicase HrpB